MARKSSLKKIADSAPEAAEPKPSPTPAPNTEKPVETPQEPPPDPGQAAAGYTVPPFDPKQFTTDPLAAAAAVERNTSAFFAELENCMLDETETQGLGVGREILINVPVRRPSRREFFRIHPDDSMSRALSLFVDDAEDGDGETYAVVKDMREVFGEDVAPTLLRLGMLRNGTLLVVPFKIPQANGGRGRKWHESFMDVGNIAKTRWIKAIADRSRSGYRVFPAAGSPSEPQWPPDKTFEEYLEIAFKDRIIKSMDHPVVRKYLGY
jgi:hypothetical protein